MMKRPFWYLCLLLVMAQHALTQDDPDYDLYDDYELDPCEPDCMGQEPGTLVPDPQSCHQYYTCLEGEEPSDFVSECPGDWKFDIVTSTCSPDFGNVTCGVCTPACAFDCPYHDITLIGSRYNCSEYRLCGMGEQDPIECPPDTPFFNGVECQTDPAFCCEPCEVFCFTAFTEIADPEDCHRFYFCNEANYYPGERDRYSCLDDEVFHDGQCVKDDGSVVCEEPCA